MRCAMLVRSGFEGVRLFGRVGDPDVTVIREFFDKNRVPHTLIDADEEEGQVALKSLGVGPDQLPFVACNRGTAPDDRRSPDSRNVWASSVRFALSHSIW